MIRVLRETHEAPREIAARVARAGGWNRFGEPNFRVVWGGSRLTWVGGRWTDYDAHGNAARTRIELRQVPKYFPEDRWHVECWLPPEAYGTPEAWRTRTLEREDGVLVPALGPYPHRGEYEHSFTLAGPRGEFLPLTPAVVEHIVRAIVWAKQQPRGAGRAALAARDERREQHWHAFAESALEDDGRPFSGSPLVAAP